MCCSPPRSPVNPGTILRSLSTGIASLSQYFIPWEPNHWSSSPLQRRTKVPRPLPTDRANSTLVSWRYFLVRQDHFDWWNLGNSCPWSILQTPLRKEGMWFTVVFRKEPQRVCFILGSSLRKLLEQVPRYVGRSSVVSKHGQCKGARTQSPRWAFMRNLDLKLCFRVNLSCIGDEKISRSWFET